jgi:hypothetical protein
MSSSWLDPLRAVLEEAPAPVTFFFRDDDAGWRDDRLRPLLGVFDRFGAPLDLAVIPAALARPLAQELRARRGENGSTLGIHQHGYAHSNHEPNGRKCEFGPARGRVAQRADIQLGRRLLEALVEGPVDPIFTPPWNRCTHATIAAEARSGGPVGVMLHHACMDAAERRRLAELLVVLTGHSRARLVRMATLVPGVAA